MVKKSKYYFDNELDAVKTRNRVYKRMVILSQNPKIQNQQVKEKTSQYKGVHWHKKTKKWYVQLHFKDGGTKSGGYFNDEQDAAKKVNQLCNEFEISEKNPGISGIPNQQVKQKTSQYIGVYWNKQNNKWGAQISFKNGNTLFGGYFNDELDAVKRVNQLCEESGINAKNPNISKVPNHLKQEKTSQYTGVHWNKQQKKWIAQLQLKNAIKKFGGGFNDEMDAGKRVNQLCDELGITVKNPEISGKPNHQAKEKSSQYKGVHWNKIRRKWQAQLRSKYKKTNYGGHFNDELDAAKRVNQLCEESGIPLKNPGISSIPTETKQSTKKSSQYTGVFWNKKIGKWCAQIKINRQIYGGSFTDELQAANKVNELCQELGIPVHNHKLETNLKNCKTLIDYNVIQEEFKELIKILDINNDPATLAIKENLIETINYGDQAIIKEINLQTKHGESALSIAAKHGFSNAVQFLISKGAEKEHFTNEHHTPLSLAVTQNHLKVAQVLMEDWISPNSHEKPYLHVSPLFNVKSREIAQLLIDNDAVTDGIYNEKNQSPLTVACQNGYLDVVEFFLDDGLDINHLDSDNKTPLFYALTNKHHDVVNLLISQGAQK